MTAWIAGHLAFCYTVGLVIGCIIIVRWALR